MFFVQHFRFFQVIFKISLIPGFFIAEIIKFLVLWPPCINQDEIQIKSKKNNNSPLFDITMGGKHGAEICELTGLFLLNGLKSIIPGLEFGLYRNNRIAAINKNTSSVAVEKINKKLHTFKKHQASDSQLKIQQQLLTIWT